MSRWFKRNLGDAMLATEQLERIRGVFLAGYEKAGTPAEMALFYRHESEGRLHCELIVYFPPAAHAVAEAVAAIPCAPPAPSGLALLAGCDAAWSRLFPEQ